MTLLDEVFTPHTLFTNGQGEVRVTLPFAAIEGALLGRPLPGTARHRRRYGRWWKGWGGPSPHAWYGWHHAG